MLCSNPIIPGFAPDPSLCRAGDDYYLVNSTFAYFPGVPVFHSRDLANWKQIGNVLDRSSQIPLAGCGHSEGIYAPTIRFHEGIFYMITTNLTGGGNFLVTARDPAGPWSEPYYLGEAAKGIDPSLFFDVDGSCYYIGQRENSAGGRYFGDCEIWIRRLDTERMQLVGEDAAVLYGFQKRAVWAEGPHLYYRDGYYYILHAESGTEFDHCVVAARSRSVLGPYEYCPHNPILTHRHLGAGYPVTCIGHGDLAEDGRGNWYMAVLGCRPQQGYTLMGRETFLARVVWENGWPVVNPGVGRLEERFELPGAPAGHAEGAAEEGSAAGTCRDGAVMTGTDHDISEKKCVVGADRGDAVQMRVCGAAEKGNFAGQSLRKEYRFAESALPPQFLMLRNPAEGTVSLTERPGFLRLHMRPETLKDPASPAYVGLRQRDRNYEAETVLQPHFCGAGDCAGLAVVQSNENHIRVECGAAAKNGGSGEPDLCDRAVVCENGLRIRVVACRKGADSVIAEDEACVRRGEIRLKISVRGLLADFYLRDGETWRALAEDVDLRFLSTEEAGGFVGCTVGMYASSNGADGGGCADFARFIYCGETVGE